MPEGANESPMKKTGLAFGRFTSSAPWPTRGGQAYGTSTYTEVVLPDDEHANCDGTKIDR
jgi:hypothetical protein